MYKKDVIDHFGTQRAVAKALTAHRVHFGISLLLTDGRGPCHCCVALTNSGVPMDSSPQTRPIQRLLVSGLVKVVACVMGISNGMDIG